MGIIPNIATYIICIIHSLYVHTVELIYFLLTVGPRFIIYPVASQEVEINEEINLTCVAEAFPRPSINQFKDGFVVLNRIVIETVISSNTLSSTLIISNASLNDAGFYYCSAINPEFTIDIAWSPRSDLTVVGKLAIY